MRMAVVIAVLGLTTMALAEGAARSPAKVAEQRWSGSAPYRACTVAAGSDDGRMAACSQAEFDREDKLLAIEYAARLRRADGALKDAIMASQRAWLTYRDPTCEAEGAVNAAGPLQTLAHATCQARLTHERVTWLLTLDP